MERRRTAKAKRNDDAQRERESEKKSVYKATCTHIYAPRYECNETDGKVR